MGTRIHLCHVSGERMKIQGSDGLSRGNINVGVMAGKSMLSFVPIHLTPSQRFGGIRSWMATWTGDDYLEWLPHQEWGNGRVFQNAGSGCEFNLCVSREISILFPFNYPN